VVAVGILHLGSFTNIRAAPSRNGYNSKVFLATLIGNDAASFTTPTMGAGSGPRVDLTVHPAQSLFEVSRGDVVGRSVVIKFPTQHRWDPYANDLWHELLNVVVLTNDPHENVVATIGVVIPGNDDEYSMIHKQVQIPRGAGLVIEHIPHDNWSRHLNQLLYTLPEGDPLQLDRLIAITRLGRDWARGIEWFHIKDIAHCDIRLGTPSHHLHVNLSL
jgi:hypothetical protein